MQTGLHDESRREVNGTQALGVVGSRRPSRTLYDRVRARCVTVDSRGPARGAAWFRQKRGCADVVARRLLDDNLANRFCDIGVG
jgi:hypothetical protein